MTCSFITANSLREIEKRGHQYPGNQGGVNNILRLRHHVTIMHLSMQDLMKEHQTTICQY